MTTPQADDMQSELTAAEAELIDRLEAACALEPSAPGAETTGELLRLRDTLRAAADAAERAVQLRDQRREITESDGAGGVREFRDGDGRDWRVWAVTPGQRDGNRNGLAQLRHEYQRGWLAFESADESERRRLLDYPADWCTRSTPELEKLLQQATRAAPRVRVQAGGQKRVV